MTGFSPQPAGQEWEARLAALRAIEGYERSRGAAWWFVRGRDCASARVEANAGLKRLREARTFSAERSEKAAVT